MRQPYEHDHKPGPIVRGLTVLLIATTVAMVAYIFLALSGVVPNPLAGLMSG